jgi:cell division protein ZapA
MKEGVRVSQNLSVNNKQRVTVTIYGQEYVVKGVETAEYLNTLAAFVDKKMKQLNQRNPNLSLLKVAVLSALNIADELHKLQEDYDALINLIEEEKKG